MRTMLELYEEKERLERLRNATDKTAAAAIYLTAALDCVGWMLGRNNTEDTPSPSDRVKLQVEGN